jgi:hypothetical protein
LEEFPLIGVEVLFVPAAIPVPGAAALPVGVVPQAASVPATPATHTARESHLFWNFDINESSRASKREQRCVVRGLHT